MGILGRTAACGLFGVLLIASGPASQAVTPSESTTTPATDVTSSHADWMKQPQAAGLLAQLTDAQADFEKAHNTQVKATKTIATLSIEINAQQAAVDAATLRIQRFAREAYIGQADADNLGALSTVMQSEGMDALAQSKALLDVVGRTQSAQIQADNAVLQHVQDLRKQQDEARTSAEATMKAAEERGQSVLKDLNDVMGISPDFEATPTTPTTCPKKVPAGALMGGSAEIGAKKLCEISVKQARSPAAAAAIVWAFNHLGEPYNSGGVPIDVENFGSFNCATFVAKAYYWGTRNAGFLGLPWTPAYASAPDFIKPVGNAHKAGDINVMWRSGDMASSGGQAGHAQLFLADGWLIQSGGTGRVTNVTRYPNGWGGWQETHFAVVNPAADR